jgi:hypothetical protein
MKTLSIYYFKFGNHFFEGDCVFPYRPLQICFIFKIFKIICYKISENFKFFSVVFSFSAYYYPKTSNLPISPFNMHTPECKKGCF